MLVTAYCPCEICCGKQPGEKGYGITASGAPVTAHGGRFVAADWSVLDRGTQISIPGYHAGRAARVLDKGGDIKGNRLDVFYPTHSQAKHWGKKWVDVAVLQQR